MQDIEAIRSAGDVIQDRYVVEELLGKGGFSAVYLVRDRQRDDKKFALKELIDQDKQETIRFAFECKVLQHLNHQALPRVYGDSDGGEGRAYMLMDYIEGPNLEMLRKQQPGKSFPLDQAIAILSPIVEALTFLHSQQPPIIHRDIKPANIIVPKNGDTSVLVDFGIAKEYHSDSTTTAVRHCSPGYGAPEQYSSDGTDLRTDIYGLAATLYALLTGITPADSLQRATKLAGGAPDPLIPLQQLLPTLPSHVANAIHRAMSISSNHRFVSVAEFWRALQPPVPSPRTIKSWIALVSKVAQQPSEPSTGPITRLPRRTFRTSKTELALLAFLALAIVIGVVLSIGYYKLSTQRVVIAPLQQPSTIVNQGNTLTPPQPTVESSVYPNVEGPYGGTIHDLYTNVTTTMTLTGILQSNNSVNGYFTGLSMDGAFQGVLDTSRHILFTVKSDTAKPPLFFEGTVRQDGNIVGNYCSLDKAGQCVGSYGIWSVKPASGS